MLGTMALVGIPMRIFLGWWGDKVSKAKLIATGVFVGAAALMGLQYATDLWQLWVFVLVFAFMQAIIPLNWALIGDLFGRRNYGTLRGVMSIIYTTGTMGMPVFAGYVFDTTQSYSIVLWVSTVLFIASSLWFANLAPPKPQGAAAAPAPAG